MTESKEWYRLSVKLAAQQLGTDVTRGLTAVEAIVGSSHPGKSAQQVAEAYKVIWQAVNNPSNQ